MTKRPKASWNWRAGHRSRQSTFSSWEMAEELHYLLGIPLDKCISKGGFCYTGPNKGRQIVQVIIKTMVEALQRGEYVRIKNFGTFKVVEKPAKKSYNSIVASSKDGEILAFSPVPKIIPARKEIVFSPSRHVIVAINKDNPSCLGYQGRSVLDKWIPDDDH